MSSVHTARALFLQHQWFRYPAFQQQGEGVTLGRVRARDGESITIGEKTLDSRTLTWDKRGLREPQALDSVPPVSEVLGLGDWIGIDANGATILYAACCEVAAGGFQELQEASTLRKQAGAWSDFLGTVRRFFHEREFLEMTTPAVAPSPGTEPFLDPIRVSLEWEGKKLDRYLITSPEFHLKKGLAAGLPRIFEIAKCFRDREGGPHHGIEFHMLEWYRAFVSLQEIADDAEALIQRLSPHTQLKRVMMSELFETLTGINLRANTTCEELVVAAKRLGIHVQTEGEARDDFNDVFHRIFLERIEPKLESYAGGQPILISHYPPSMAALSRIDQATGFADRFEIYWKGLELCNAFHELNDPQENRKRFEHDNQMKRKSGREPVALDDGLLRSLDYGMPPSGGIALGLERLFMAVHGKSAITDVRPFSLIID